MTKPEMLAKMLAQSGWVITTKTDDGAKICVPATK